MFLALDVYYYESEALSVGILFQLNEDQPNDILYEKIYGFSPYESGAFYKRELPCLLKVIQSVNIDNVEAIIVDGHIYTDNNGSLGLGGKLYHELGMRTPVIGVAKNPFSSNSATTREAFRGKSKKPLFISSIGIDSDNAVNIVMRMHGAHRIPTLLKLLDTYTRTSFEDIGRLKK